MAKQRVFFVDEGQVLGRGNWESKCLSLRHHGVHLIAGYQNASAAPVEFSGNCDLFVSFRCTDRRDREAVSKVMNLSREQSEHLASLRVGECVCFMPGVSASAFLGSVPRIEFSFIEDSVIQSGSRDFLKQFEWVPVQESGLSGVSGGIGVSKDSSSVNVGSSGVSGLSGSIEGKKFESMVRAFLEDVANPVHQFSRLTRRWERIGCRSAVMQERILKKTKVEGMIAVWPLAVNLRGAPIKLVELTEKGALNLGVEYKKGNERLDTRAGKDLVFRKFGSIDGWSAFKEAMIEGKRIDVLVRNGDGKAAAFEIAGASGKHEVHNCLHNLKFDEIEKHFVVCLGKKVFDEVRKRFADFPLLVGNERVEVVTLARVLSDGFVL